MENREAPLGDLLKTWRKRRALTQEALAKAVTGTGLNLSESLIAHVETGRRTLSLERAEAVADVLDLSDEERRTMHFMRAVQRALLGPPSPPIDHSAEYHQLAGEALRAQREAVGLSIEDAADKAAVPPKMWQAIEAGDQIPVSEAQRARICTTVDWDPAILTALTALGTELAAPEIAPLLLEVRIEALEEAVAELTELVKEAFEARDSTPGAAS